MMVYLEMLIWVGFWGSVRKVWFFWVIGILLFLLSWLFMCFDMFSIVFSVLVLVLLM